MNTYLNATPEAGKEFYTEQIQKGEAITMLNLLKFKTKADYQNLDAIKPEKEITGEHAYSIYTKNTSEALSNLGSEILYFGKSKSFLIGPDSEKWDAVLLVKHKSLESFMEFSKSETYLKNVGHRTAGLSDSRLLPTNEISEKR